MAKRHESRLGRVLTVGLSVAGATAISAVMALPAGAAVTSPANNLIIGSGSSTTYTMMLGLDRLFNTSTSCALFAATGTQPLDFSCSGGAGDALAVQASPTNTPENPFADVAVSEPPLGSSNGIKQLEFGSSAVGAHSTTVNVADNVSYARSSRSLNTGAKGDFTGLNFVAYAKDGVTPMHYTKVASVATPSALVTDLSQVQLQNIYNGSIANWNQLFNTGTTTPAPTAPIVVFAPQAGSGTQATLKTFLGFDPTIGGKPVNCANPGTLSAGLYSGGSGCVGPVVIFENEIAQMLKSSFLPSQQSYLSGGVWGNATFKDTVTATYPIGTTTVTIDPTKGTTSNLAPGTVVTWGLESLTVASTTSTTVTFTHGTTKGHTALTTFSYSAAANATANQIKADGIFAYSAGAWNRQCTGSTLSKSYCGGAGPLPTATTGVALTSLNGIAPTQANILDDAFPNNRFLYNVYSNGSNALINPVATPSTLNYVSEAGFICKPQNASIIDTATGNTYLTDIQTVIKNNGFYPLSAGAGGGTINSTPIDEGSVSHGVGTLSLGTYAPYLNVSGTGLAGGYITQANTNPSGFCLVSSTEDNGSGNPS